MLILPRITYPTEINNFSTYLTKELSSHEFDTQILAEDKFHMP